MKLSILLITYNQEKYIEECINGIIEQYLPYEFEIIVADDFSSDKTLSIIKARLGEKNFPLEVLFNDKNLGISKNYKRAFQQCKGEYVAIIEGDDYWTDKNRLFKHVKFLDEHDECVMSFNRFVIYHEENRKFEIPSWDSRDNFEYITTSRLAQGNCIGNMSACVFRNSALKKIRPNLFELNVADWMLGMVIGQFGLLAKHKDIMSVYRITSNGKWNSLSSIEKRKRILKNIELYNKYLEYNYNDEFTFYKKKIMKENNQVILKMIFLTTIIPPILIYLFKLFVPEKLIYYIKKLINRN